jgi:uncharacterized surface protein with fasciclin (FAS1) repeats
MKSSPKLAALLGAAMATTALIVGVPALAGSGQSAQKTVMVGGAAMLPARNIVENAVNSADHTTLVEAVKAAGLVDTLASPGPFTVFAPTNAAFAKLPAGTVESLVQPGSDQNPDLPCRIGQRQLQPARPHDPRRARQGRADHRFRRQADRADERSRCCADR